MLRTRPLGPVGVRRGLLWLRSRLTPVPLPFDPSDSLSPPASNASLSQPQGWGGGSIQRRSRPSEGRRSPSLSPATTGLEVRQIEPEHGRETPKTLFIGLGGEVRRAISNEGIRKLEQDLWAVVHEQMIQELGRRVSLRQVGQSREGRTVTPKAILPRPWPKSLSHRKVVAGLRGRAHQVADLASYARALNEQSRGGW